MHPPPPLDAKPPPWAKESINWPTYTSGMPPPPGGATTSPDFLSNTPCRATLFKPHTHDDVFSASAVKSPSYAFNLVGRRLLLAETCSRRPSRKQPCICLLSLAALADRAQANPTGDFATKNIKSRRSLRIPPPLHFHHSPSPSIHLNCIHRIRLQLREYIEGGGH